MRTSKPAGQAGARKALSATPTVPACHFAWAAGITPSSLMAWTFGSGALLSAPLILIATAPQSVTNRPRSSMRVGARPGEAKLTSAAEPSVAGRMVRSPSARIGH